MTELESDYCEAIVILSRPEARGSVRSWAEAHGLSVMGMRAGLLLSGSRKGFSTAFDISLEGESPPIHLPIPEAVGDDVQSIVIRSPPEYTSRDPE
jgi:hypothetical protein